MLQIFDRREMLRRHLHDSQRIEHAARANVTAGLAAAIGAPYQQAAGGNSGKVVLGGGGAIHLLVHRRDDGHRRGRSQANRGDQIVRHTGGDAGD